MQAIYTIITNYILLVCAKRRQATTSSREEHTYMYDLSRYAYDTIYYSTTTRFPKLS